MILSTKTIPQYRRTSVSGEADTDPGVRRGCEEIVALGAHPMVSLHGLSGQSNGCQHPLQMVAFLDYPHEAGNDKGGI